jgi:hypothetical protein
MPALRIAIFNVENLDETAPGERPSLAERVALMRPQIARPGADIACFPEVNGQERPGQPRALLALQELLAGTTLDGAAMVSTTPEHDAVYDERNLVVDVVHCRVRRSRLPDAAGRHAAEVHAVVQQRQQAGRITCGERRGEPLPGTVGRAGGHVFQHRCLL